VLEANEKRFCHVLAEGSATSPGFETFETQLPGVPHIEMGGANTSLDVDGMAMLMREVQRASLAHVQSVEEDLVASAANVASCAVLRDAANTSALESAAEAAKGVHSTCRATEQALLLEQRSNYQELNATWSGRTAPSCSASMVPTDPWESRVACFGDVQAWLQDESIAMEAKLSSWVASLHAEHNQTSLCGSLQHAFEESVCSFTEKQNLTCAEYEACFEDASAEHAQLVSDASSVERSSKVDFVVAEHILCKLKVLNASSPGDKETLLAMCESAIANTSHLNLTYPELVTLDLCPVPNNFPCMASWWDQTYANASWYGTVELHACSPCSTTTTSTMTSMMMLEVAAAMYSSYLQDGSSLWAWGRNEHGRLGDGTEEDRQTPVKVVMSDVRSVAGGGESHAVFVTNNGTAYYMGRPGVGPVVSTPTAFMSGVSDVFVQARSSTTIVVKEDGTAWTAGDNRIGQLGDGTLSNRWPPVQVMSDVRSACAGHRHTVFVKKDGTAWATGQNYGQLGIEPLGHVSVPTQMAGVTGVVACAADYSSTVLLKEDGTVWTTGKNVQVGNGGDTRVVKQIPTLTDVVSISAGGDGHALYLTADGTAWSGGYNYKGRLGDGTEIEQTSQPIPVMTNVTRIAAGGQHSLWLKTDGTVWTAGSNQYGQLGTPTNSISPVQVVWG